MTGISWTSYIIIIITYNKIAYKECDFEREGQGNSEFFAILLLKYFCVQNMLVGAKNYTSMSSQYNSRRPYYQQYTPGTG